MSRCLTSDTTILKLNCIYSRYSLTISFRNAIKSDLQEEEDFEEIIQTIKFIAKDTPALPLESIIPPNEVLPKTRETLHSICEKFNRCVNTIRFLEKGTSLPAKRNSATPSRELCQHIYQLSYKKAIKNPKLLNKYEPFSSEVYGETNFEFICLILDYLKISQNDVFLDLGSGIGNVVMVVAALSSCKLAVGIEKNKYPSIYADTFSRYFKIWMRWFGKKAVKVDLIHDDFLSEASLEIIRKATVIFVNNFAFGAEINHQLALQFQDLADGVRIISPLPFGREKFRLTDRGLDDIASIMRIETIPPLCGSVSWTAKDIQYYVHTIDRTKLENYFLKRTSDKSCQSIPINLPPMFDVGPQKVEDKSELETETEVDDVNSSDREIDVDQQIELALNNLLKMYEQQLMSFVDTMKQDSYQDYIKSLIAIEHNRRHQLLEQINYLNGHIMVLETEREERERNHFDNIWESIKNYKADIDT